jgi:hypothetical protein
MKETNANRSGVRANSGREEAKRTRRRRGKRAIVMKPIKTVGTGHTGTGIELCPRENVHRRGKGRHMVERGVEER